ncbi:mRNA splicing protein CDC5 (Myb superfamily) [Trachipleistophora hominis]|uniref:mRNA splicing protein CDC5 (Myb superfamily) n=1 Tax=Trachipleistophora hominis TaxID=72359 RepID=L7K0E9_TRAHO|nr:mRNA splicing protein CDC5 (Myb superfamily) [Trachipleistophora hominis]
MVKWTSSEDKILLLAAQKYGLSHLHKISTLLSRSPSACCARYNHLTRKKEWTRSSDLQLIKYARKMPNQFNSIASLMGTTAAHVQERLDLLVKSDVDAFRYDELRENIHDGEEYKCADKDLMINVRLGNVKNRKEMRKEFIGASDATKIKLKNKSIIDRIMCKKIKCANIREVIANMPAPKNS